MLASDFQRNLRKCNSNLRIFCGDDDTKAAGIYRIVCGEYEAIMGIDKNFVPEWPEYDGKGHIVKSGWRRVMNYLIFGNRMVEKSKAEKIFNTHFYPWVKGPKNVIAPNPIDVAIKEAQVRNMVRTGKPGIHRDDVVDIAKELKKNER